jgi:hypothetical protein
LAKLEDTVAELGLVHVGALGLVEWHKHAAEEDAVLALQGQGKAIDNRAHNLEQLWDAVVPLRLVHKRIKNVVDRLANKGAQRQKLAIQAVQRRFQKVALARVLPVKQLQQLGRRPRSACMAWARQTG